MTFSDKVNLGVGLATAFVAFATFVLAIYTRQSVVESKALLLAEDRRFQLGLAPIVLAYAYLLEEPDHLFTGFRLRNSGRGIAMKVKVRMSIDLLHYKKGFGPGDVPQEDYQRERSDNGKPWIDTCNLAALAAGAEGDASMWSPETPGCYVGLINVAGLTITYEDMFGTKYATEYNSYPDGYTWGPA